MINVRLVVSPDGRSRPHFGDAVRHYDATGDLEPWLAYRRAHRAQEARIRRHARRFGLRLIKMGTECSNVCSLWNGDTRVICGSQGLIEEWLRRGGPIDEIEVQDSYQITEGSECEHSVSSRPSVAVVGSSKSPD